MISLILLGGLFVFHNVKAASGINKELTYFGVLKSFSGAIATDGNYDMVFKIYTTATGGTPVWTGNYTTANSNAVAVKDGNFTVLLGSGSGNTMTVDFSQDTYYAGITVGTDVEMSPRQRIGAAAYAFNADAVNGTSVYQGTGDPNGVQTGSVGDMAIDSTNDKLYIKTSGTATNTGWSEIVGSGGVTTLSALTDTDISNPAAGDVLVMNSSNKWANESTGDITGSSGLTVAGGSNSILGGGVTISLNNGAITASKLDQALSLGSGQTLSAGSGTLTANALISGTYGISISGNAATATSATSATNATNATTATTAGSLSGTLPFSQLGNPTQNTTLSMGSNKAGLTFGASTGSNDLFSLSDTTGNSGTGYLMNITTNTGSLLNPLHISAGGGMEGLTVNSSGQVGIGTTSPGSQLSVVGGATFGSLYASQLMADGNVAIQGNLGIGTTNPQAALEVNGNAQFDGSVKIGGTYITANTLAQLTADANFAGTVYLTAPVTLTGDLALTCDLRPMQGATITTTGHTLSMSIPTAGRYQIFAGTGTVTFSNGGTVYPEWFGAKGDDSTDDFAALQAAGNSLVNVGGTLLGDVSKTYKDNEYIVYTNINNLTIKDLALDCVNLISTGNNACTAAAAPYGCCTGYHAGTCGPPYTALMISGTVTTTTTTVTGPLDVTNTFVPTTTLTLNVANSTGFAPGDMLEIISTQPWGGCGTGNYVTSELSSIASVGNNTITLKTGLRTDYTISAGSGYVMTLTRIIPIENPVLDNVKITGAGSGQRQSAVGIRYANSPIIMDSKSTNCDVGGFDFNWTDHGLMTNNEVYNCADTTYPAGYPYSLSNGNNWATIENSKGINVRNGITSAGYELDWNPTIKGCSFSGALPPLNGGQAINSHRNSVNMIVDGNHVENIQEGIVLSGIGTQIVNNVVTGNWTTNGSGYGIALLDWCLGTNYAINTNARTQISNNYVSGTRGIATSTSNGQCTAPGVPFACCTGNGTGTCASYGVNITGNTVIGQTINGITADYGIDVTTGQTNISGNNVSGFTTDLFFPGTPPSSTWKTGMMVNNMIEGASQGYGILDNANGAGLTNATNAGYVKSSNNATLVLNGTFYNWTAHDNWWDLTGVNTTTDCSASCTAAGVPFAWCTGSGTGTCYRKVAIVLSPTHSPQIIKGSIEATQAVATLPQIPYNDYLLGWVEIPNGYAGGSLAGFVFHNLTGMFQQIP
ncbi:MAG: hypothetical protein P4L62_04035 [Candidatus Pacebacteria bacterium]|nr:hypothetical protein [Candidatus Paceibacterota bacterium]